MTTEIDRPSNEISTPQEIEQMVEKIKTANLDLFMGDCGLWKRLMSQDEDVTLYGAYGGYVRGPEEVPARFERTATGYGKGGGGGRTSFELLATWSSPGLAVITGLERHEWQQAGKPEMTSFVYRVTHVLRLETSGWKIVLRHADPLATFRGPEFAHRG